MPLDLSSVGTSSEPHDVSWTRDDAMLYALGVGAGAVEDLDELAFVTENTQGVPQQILPTFPVVFAYGAPLPSYGEIDRTKLVAAGQSVELLRPLAPSGEGTYTTTITGIFDKGSGALVTTESILTDRAGAAIARLKRESFIRGEGGFGGSRGDSQTWASPDRAADVVIEQETLPVQALLYRLSGDRNRLHSDPTFARAGGFSRPILHGLCTYGFAGRALLHGVAGSDPHRLQAISARFSSPVVPGDVLRTSIWRTDEGAVFETHNGSGAPVLSHGRARITASEGAV